MARVAFIVDDVFEDSEFQEPYDHVKEAGHEAVIVGLSAGKEITGKKGSKVTVEKGSTDVSADEFDAVVVPGGYSPDKVRTDANLVSLVRQAYEDGKPVAAICHAGWMLAEADILRGKTVTSYHSIRTDLINAGANWVDEELVTDGNLITSRTPKDLPAFNAALVAAIK
ncbi:type 1 glutamine amidotransferase domain-containing protein [Phytoactinopolyspora mesophila]|uniref:DJ-1/PfpI/YhbO family deglycase/protease n=1 Tax=Phytoactinopolyspora mesophila TaxID=2650750 RepID=A0A7K3MC93_9ACTN|nr:type 1 glutamine amidotransferase domain-containing protein [Phytoactinopolyspora mesophila]NDL60913.1 DJ-1/PfpI/YhbO family deglycase/protease [Phytoactinopolyspora mesophila]